VETATEHPSATLPSTDRELGMTLVKGGGCIRNQLNLVRPNPIST
jgi:hypothetical protein